MKPVIHLNYPQPIIRIKPIQTNSIKPNPVDTFESLHCAHFGSQKTVTKNTSPSFLEAIQCAGFKVNKSLLRKTLQSKRFVAHGRENSVYRFPDKIKGFALRLPTNQVLSDIPDNMDYQSNPNAVQLKNIGDVVGTIGNYYQVVRWIKGKPAGHAYMDTLNALEGHARGHYKQSASRGILFRQLRIPLTNIFFIKPKPTSSDIKAYMHYALHCYTAFSKNEEPTLQVPEKFKQRHTISKHPNFTAKRYQHFLEVYHDFEVQAVKGFQEIAQDMSQEAYNNAGKTIKELALHGQKLDFNHPQNTMVDIHNQQFGFVDLPENWNFNHQIANCTDFAKGLLGGTKNRFIGQYLGRDKPYTDAVNSAKTIIQKIEHAAQINDIPFDKEELYQWCGITG